MRNLKLYILIACLLCACMISACNGKGMTAINNQREYGVFLSVEDNLDSLDEYKTIVIDAQYFGTSEIKEFKNREHKVYSYINVGSLEDFRDYYDTYKDLSIGGYEHWDDEIWIDVSDERWQDFILNTLAPDLLNKGIDGFFVDNCDVYYQCETELILDGLSNIMQGLKNTVS